MTAEETPVSEEVSEAPAAARRRIHLTPRQGIYIALAIVLSVAGGGALPQGHSYRITGEPPSVADPALASGWQPLGTYVLERGLTRAMTLDERLQHEAEQRKLLNPVDEPEQKLNVRIPLLPGPVQRADSQPVIPPTIESTAAQLAPPPAVVEQVKAEPQPAPTKADPLAENLETLKALQDALEQMNAERNAEISTYRNDQVNQ